MYNGDEDPGYIISTFNTQEEVAKAYGLRATPKALPSERVKKLADDITKDKKSNDDIAHSLYDWVATNITYAGNCVGLGAVVPHDLDFILDNKMGDCKDHATLLQSLLSAKNIKRDYNSEIDSESSLPDDCIEISYDDAMLLSGDCSAIPPIPTSNMPENSSNAFNSNSSERDNVSVMKEGKYEHGSA